jgi:hypothetical protein
VPVECGYTRPLDLKLITNARVNQGARRYDAFDEGYFQMEGK